jgi:hypothetical protein
LYNRASTSTYLDERRIADACKEESSQSNKSPCKSQESDEEKEVVFRVEPVLRAKKE